MKIRWTRGSLRFRISPSELDQLVSGDSILEKLQVPGGSWCATLKAGTETSVEMTGSHLRLQLCPKDISLLMVPSREGVYFTGVNDQPFRYYVEKDFPCAHPGAPDAKEPESETFAAPVGFKERHRR